MDRCDPAYIFVLIHGTFGRLLADEPVWTKQDSVLCDSLRKQLGSSIDFKGFHWARWNNSHRSRLKAGRELAAYLRALARDYPTAKCYLIAHSHGGNVALYALRELAATHTSLIDGVICLGTPFICTEIRNLGWLTNFFSLIIVFFFAPICLLAMILHIMRPDIGFFLHPVIVDVLGFYVFFVLPAMIVVPIVLSHPKVLGADFEKRIAAWWKDGAARIAGKLTADFSGVPVFCARAQADEAKFFLHAVNAVTDAPIRVLQRFLPFAFIPFFVFGLMVKYGDRVDVLGQLADPVLYVFSWIGLFLVLSVLINFVVRTPFWGFGERPFLNWMINVRTNDVPRGEPGPFVRTYRYQHVTLNHSFLCFDQAVFCDVAGWIKEGSPAGAVTSAEVDVAPREARISWTTRLLTSPSGDGLFGSSFFYLSLGAVILIVVIFALSSGEIQLSGRGRPLPPVRFEDHPIVFFLLTSVVLLIAMSLWYAAWLVWRQHGKKRKPQAEKGESPGE